MTMNYSAAMAISGSGDDRQTQQQRAYPVERWIEPCDVALDVDLRSRHHALEVAATTLWRMHGLDEDSVLRALWRRELVGSTALGCGVAIPHARIDGIAQPMVLYMRAKTPIDFAAPDGKPVRHVLTIAVPADGDPEAHLALLAAVASMVTERQFRERLAAAEDAHAIRRAFAEFGRAAGAAPA